jgi:hypothetical protein
VLGRVTRSARIFRSSDASIWREAGVDRERPDLFCRRPLTGAGWQIRDILGNGTNATRVLIATWHTGRLHGDGCYRRKTFLMCAAVVPTVIGCARLRFGNDLVECTIRGLRKRSHPAHECERYERGHGSYRHRSRTGQ